MIEGLPTILLCFYSHSKTCRSLTQRNDGALRDIEIDKIVIWDSTYRHHYATIANYQGLPLILGELNHNKLEMLNTMENPPRWIEYEGTDYPYSKR